MATSEPAPPPPAPSRRPRYGVLHAWSNLSSAQQRTAAAAVVVLVSLGAPWYTKSVTSFPGPRTSDSSLSAFGSFSFVEAAVLLVAAAVMALTWGRATERAFTLPFRDGTLVTAAAGWVGVLVVYRLFDHPANETASGAGGSGISTTIGLSWGIFASLAAVGLLLATGLDQRRGAAEPASRSRRRERERPVVDPRAVADRDEHDWDPAPPRRRERDAAARERARRDDGPAPERAPDGRPREAPRRDDGWAASDPAGERRSRTPRGPSSGQDATRALGREDAARLLRESGLDSGSHERPPARRERPPHGSWAEDDPTRHVLRDDDPTRHVPREDDPTRHVPRQDDPTRIAPADDERRDRRRRRDQPR